MLELQLQKRMYISIGHIPALLNLSKAIYHRQFQQILLLFFVDARDNAFLLKVSRDLVDPLLKSGGSKRPFDAVFVTCSRNIRGSTIYDTPAGNSLVGYSIITRKLRRTHDKNDT